LKIFPEERSVSLLRAVLATYLMKLRQWKFYAEASDEEEGFYLDEENIFTGTSREADLEAGRRADLWEERTGGLILKVTYESQGIVP